MITLIINTDTGLIKYKNVDSISIYDIESFRFPFMQFLKNYRIIFFLLSFIFN